jgi:hypothetical protein
MNANELADKLQLDKARALLYVDTVVEAAAMLRQQQVEIEVLKAEKDQAFKDGYSMGQKATLNIR